jgi:hypothetical protein
MGRQEPLAEQDLLWENADKEEGKARSTIWVLPRKDRIRKVISTGLVVPAYNPSYLRDQGGRTAHSIRKANGTLSQKENTNKRAGIMVQVAVCLPSVCEAPRTTKTNELNK